MNRLSRIWEKASPWIVGVLAVLFVMSVVGNFALELNANRSQNNHHAATVKSDAQIKALVKELTTATAANHKLGMSNNALAKEIIKDSATVSADAGLVYQQNVALCTALHISLTACPGAP